MDKWHCIAIIVPGVVLASNVNPAAGDTLYWAQFGGIKRARLDGSMIEDVVTVADPKSVAVDPIAGKIYFSSWAGSSSGPIQRANLDGTGVEIIVPTSSDEQYMDLALDAESGKLYWGTNGTLGTHDRLRRANLDGTAVETIYESPNASWLEGIQLDLSSEKIYWVDRFVGRVQRANLDGTDVQTLFDSSGTVSDLAIDLVDQMMYIVENSAEIVTRCDLSGMNCELFVPLQAQRIDLHQPSRKLYSFLSGVLTTVCLEDGSVETLVDIGTGGYEVAFRNVTGDVNGDGTTGILDFLLVLANWGPCPQPCPNGCPPSCAGDVDGDCDVGIVDFLLVLSNWTG